MEPVLCPIAPELVELPDRYRRGPGGAPLGAQTDGE